VTRSLAEPISNTATPASRPTTRIPPLQLAALKKAGCQTVFKDEGISGATTKRPALLRCLKKLEHGDTLIVWKLERLGRSLRDLITMLDDLRARVVKFHSLTEAIRHGDAHGPRHLADDRRVSRVRKVACFNVPAPE
jgi:DNA invertase Pin-like site-specific DNA recombinase